MITIKPITIAAISDRFAASRGGGTIPNSSWRGDARYLLPVTEPVPLRELLCTFNGYTPDAKVSLLPLRLQNAEPPGWSIHALAPTTVRNLWAVSGERTRLKIENAHQHAASSCLHELERSFHDLKTDLPTTETRGVLVAAVQQNPEVQSVPHLETEAYMPNLHLSLKGAAQRCPLSDHQLDAKANALTGVYRQMLCDWLSETMGLDFVHEQGREPVIVGVPESLVFTETTADKRPRTLSTLLRSTESLKFEDWQGQAARQGWGKADAEALVSRAAQRVSVLATVERSESPKHESTATAMNSKESLEKEAEKHAQNHTMSMSM